jgi:hypothetical protein
MKALDKIPSGSWGINFGGGVNSTAMLLFCHDRGLQPEWVLFADTGSEWPGTYELVQLIETWCTSVGFPFSRTKWMRTRKAPLGFEPVHKNCLRTKYLPSRAYGYAGCTSKWKIQPAERWRKDHGFKTSTIALGYDAGEEKRVRRALGKSTTGFWYPLVAWGYDRITCEKRILEAGWPIQKSACFCCPSTKKEEWRTLLKKHPELFQISRKIELQAKEAGNAETASIFKSAKECVWCHS